MVSTWEKLIGQKIRHHRVQGVMSRKQIQITLRWVICSTAPALPLRDHKAVTLSEILLKAQIMREDGEWEWQKEACWPCPCPTKSVVDNYTLRRAWTRPAVLVQLSTSTAVECWQDLQQSVNEDSSKPFWETTLDGKCMFIPNLWKVMFNPEAGLSYFGGIFGTKKWVHSLRSPLNWTNMFILALTEKCCLSVNIFMSWHPHFFKTAQCRRLYSCDWFDEHSHTLSHRNWPAKSPDLYLIENLWGFLEQRVKRWIQHPHNLVDLHNPQRMA